MANNNSNRAITLYYIRNMMNDLSNKVDNDEFFDTQEFHEFMSSHYPTSRMTTGRVNDFKKYYKGTFERMLKIVNKSLQAYEKD